MNRQQAVCSCDHDTRAFQSLHILCCPRPDSGSRVDEVQRGVSSALQTISSRMSARQCLTCSAGQVCAVPRWNSTTEPRITFCRSRVNRFLCLTMRCPYFQRLTHNTVHSMEGVEKIDSFGIVPSKTLRRWKMHFFGVDI